MIDGTSDAWPTDGFASPCDTAADAERLKEFICAWPGVSLGTAMLLIQWVDAAFAALPCPQGHGDALTQRLRGFLHRAASTERSAPAASGDVVRLRPPPPQLVDYI